MGKRPDNKLTRRDFVKGSGATFLLALLSAVALKLSLRRL
jgi:hypothetical protein